MKYIKLTKGKRTLVDDDDYDWANQFKWHLSSNGYAVRTSENRQLHRYINKTPANFDTDHINRNKLDNRKCNLRTVTRSQNNFNSLPPKDNKSGVKGVWWSKRWKLWYAQIKVNGKTYCLGSSKIKKEAIKLRLNAEKEFIKYDNTLCR